MIPIKTCQEIDKMRSTGHILAAIMDELEAMITPGVATMDLDSAAQEAIFKAEARSAFKGYRGYPAHICVSLNEAVVHGIPGPRRIQEGDIVSIDIGIERGGFFVDMAKTFAVGRVDAVKQRLLEVTRQSLEQAIRMAQPGRRLGDVSGAVQQYVESRGFSVVRDFVGHGIGRALHEEPQIPNFKTAEPGALLEEGMVLAIEPMINAGTWEVTVLEDGWTAVTKDKQPSAHFEHTVAVGKNGPEILTQ